MKTSPESEPGAVATGFFELGMWIFVTFCQSIMDSDL